MKRNTTRKTAKKPSSLDAATKKYTPPTISLKDVLSEYRIELTKDDLNILDSASGILSSGVEKVFLSKNRKTDRIDVEGDYKQICCTNVKVSDISDKSYFDTKTECKLHIECSMWHFPAPDYKYSTIKKNLEKTICEILRLQSATVKSFSTGIIEYDTEDR